MEVDGAPFTATAPTSPYHPEMLCVLLSHGCRAHQSWEGETSGNFFSLPFICRMRSVSAPDPAMNDKQYFVHHITGVYLLPFPDPAPTPAVYYNAPVPKCPGKILLKAFLKMV